MPRSSANPFKLSSYSTGGLEFVHDELHRAGPGESLGQETTEIGALTALVTEADVVGRARRAGGTLLRVRDGRVDRAVSLDNEAAGDPPP